MREGNVGRKFDSTPQGVVKAWSRIRIEHEFKIKNAHLRPCASETASVFRLLCHHHRMVKTNNSHEVTFLAGEECLYSVVKRAALSLGWKLIEEDASDSVKRDCHVIWVDKSFANDKRFISIQPWQRINHFPGMTNICRKVRLAQSLELMKKKFPREYSFFPTTYVLPLHLAAFRSLFPNGQSMSTFIIKPDGSAQGKGIFLTKRIEDVENLSNMCVAQQYISKPLLIDKKKFDLRIYVLVTNCCPLRVYLFRDGLVRMCTEEYKHPTDKNLRQKCMHLTNYAINKRSDKYQREEKESAPSNTGNKRTISWLLDWLKQERGEAAANELWDKIGDICVMTILSILPTLQREYDSVFGKTKLQTQQQSNSSTSGSNDDRSSFEERSRCFELLGFDIMIDTKLNPILIEVNHLPSWGTDSSIDELIKSRVIVQALSAINVKSHEKRVYERARRKQSQLRLQSRKQSVDDLDRDGDLPSEQNQPPHATKKRQPELFDSNSAERKIRSIYEKFAPEKLPHLKDLMNKFRGYEEWLAMKVEEKYMHTNDDSSSSCSCSDEMDGDTATTTDEEDDDDDDDFIEESEKAILLEEDRILEDYDRIYPPNNNGCISLSRYKQMERYVAEMDEERQRRLTCPLHEMRSNSNGQVENEFGARGSNKLNREDGWIGGNVHVRQNRQGPKIFAPPTKQQIEFASRLCLGFSVEDTEVTTRSVKRKSRLLHHNLIDEEDNPFYHLIDRVRQTREISKQTRGRVERRLSCRISNGAASLRHQNLDLALEVPTVKLNARRRNTYTFLPKIST
jgi:tubulin polyglutamylase TTLL6/13